MNSDNENNTDSDKEPTKDWTMRRVYVLPTDLVARINSHQKEMGFSSEVEAVRRLLDEALMHRDTMDTIIRRFTKQLGKSLVLSDVVKDVLVGHPLVEEIHQKGDSITFKMTGGVSIQIRRDGKTMIDNGFGDSYDYDEIPF